jgi:parallel beta-helix repeat protein
MKLTDQLRGAALAILLAVTPACGDNADPPLGGSQGTEGEGEGESELEVTCFTPKENHAYDTAVSVTICPGTYTGVSFNLISSNLTIVGTDVVLEQVEDVTDQDSYAIQSHGNDDITIHGFTLNGYRNGVVFTTDTPYKELQSICVRVEGGSPCPTDPEELRSEKGSMNLTIEGLTLTGPGTQYEKESKFGIYVKGYGHVRIKGNTVQKIANAIAVEDIYNSVIEDNTVEDNGVGINITTRRTGLLPVNVIVAHNDIGRNRFGVMNSFPGEVTFENNNFYDNERDGIKHEE